MELSRDDDLISISFGKINSLYKIHKIHTFPYRYKMLSDILFTMGKFMECNNHRPQPISSTERKMYIIFTHDAIKTVERTQHCKNRHVMRTSNREKPDHVAILQGQTKNERHLKDLVF